MDPGNPDPMGASQGTVGVPTEDPVKGRCPMHGMLPQLLSEHITAEPRGGGTHDPSRDLDRSLEAWSLWGSSMVLAT